MIYLDYASATPIDPKISKLMSSCEREYFSNAGSIHKSGVDARKIIEESRAQIAKLLFAHPDEIIFTGSGTESDALAILGLITNYELQIINEDRKIPHIVTTNIEHPAILENLKILEMKGRAEVTYVAVEANGIVNLKTINESLKDNTILVSVMYANNEIGTIQPIQEIAKVIRHHRKNRNSSLPYFHTDACQAVNYLPMENIEKLGVDLLTFNSSKIYGPKGIGCLYKKRGIELAPLYGGGGQEFGLRSGTENTSSTVGMAKAFEITFKMKKKESARLTKLRDYAINKLLALSRTSTKKSDSEIILNGDEVNRLPNNINISVLGISSELLVIELDAKGIRVSAKSACKSDEPDESHVISALRMVQKIESSTTDGSLRISLGRQTSKRDMDVLVKALKDILSKYKKWK